MYLGCKFDDTTWAGLVQRMVALALSESAPMSSRGHWFRQASELMRKTDHPRSALTLDWRPFYDLLKSRYVTPKVTPTSTASTSVDSTFRASVITFLSRARRYFDPAAGPAIVEELRSDLTLLQSRRCFVAATLLVLFLPSNLTKNPWVDDWMQIWDWVHHCRDWDGVWFTLVARAAKHAVQTPSQWLARLPTIFSRILESFCLPVGKKGAPPSAQLPGEATSLLPGTFFQSSGGKKAKVVGYLLGVGGTSQEGTLGHLRRLLTAVSTYFHPSNQGQWGGQLGRFVLSLAGAFARRVGHERGSEGSRAKHMPESVRAGFVDALLPVLQQALYSRQGYVRTCAAH